MVVWIKAFRYITYNQRFWCGRRVRGGGVARLSLSCGLTRAEEEEEEEHKGRTNNSRHSHTKLFEINYTIFSEMRDTVQ